MKFEDCIYKGVCETTCKAGCLRYIEMKYLLKCSNIPKARQKINKLIPEECDIKSFEKLAEMRDSIKEFTDSGNSLYIYSSVCGNGKTTWSIKLMLQYFDEIWAGNGFRTRGIFLNVPTFLSKCKTVISKPDAEFEKMKELLPIVDLVIFDDIAATKLSEYDYNLLLTFIDQRTLDCKATIYTGNIEPCKLESYLGARLASRVCGNETLKVQLKGGDCR